ncbi:hypothetical protein L798_10110 [Zootermopsis nevadensis]|uniref:Uncharacterized protein n=1 Tax=Zootermopsis nevadensis TaxID=136037 RepID=A0A067R2X3_ZOONE|nr:hypothetical protein L798_10110 [Zootermopsis nevadensis]
MEMVANITGVFFSQIEARRLCEVRLVTKCLGRSDIEIWPPLQGGNGIRNFCDIMDSSQQQHSDRLHQAQHQLQFTGQPKDLQEKRQVKWGKQTPKCHPVEAHHHKIPRPPKPSCFSLMNGERKWLSSIQKTVTNRSV